MCGENGILVFDKKSTQNSKTITLTGICVRDAHLQMPFNSASPTLQPTATRLANMLEAAMGAHQKELELYRFKRLRFILDKVNPGPSTTMLKLNSAVITKLRELD